MKLLCNGNDLSDAVSKVIKATSTRTTNPVLEGIKLSAADGALTLTATDLELAIEKSIVADVKIEGETVVPGKVFADFVKKLNTEQIELTLDSSNRLKIKYTDSEGFLNCLNPQEFPPVKELNEAQKFAMIKSEFIDLINKISFSVSVDDARPMLKGVHLEVSEAGVTGVALDGYRMAKCVKPIEKTTAMMSLTVPARCLNEIAKLIENNEEPVEVCVQKNYMLINLDHTRITTRLLDGDYINYRQIVPDNFESSVTVAREQFEAGLERAILLAKSDKNNLVRFDIKENVMQLSSNSAVGNITEKIPVRLAGLDISIAFNARYFTELLRYVGCDSVVIKFINSVSPCVVVPGNSVDEFMYLILPVRMVN